MCEPISRSVERQRTAMDDGSVEVVTVIVEVYAPGDAPLEDLP